VPPRPPLGPRVPAPYSHGARRMHRLAGHCAACSNNSTKKAKTLGSIHRSIFSLIACAERVWRILFGGHKGLLVLNPLLAGLFLAPLALPALDRRYRAVLAPLLVSILCNLLLCSTNPSWHGGRGFGPRYMLDGLGIAFVLSGVGIANAANHLPRVAAGLVGIAGAYSVVLNLFGAIGSRLRDPWLVELHQRMLLP
jgi:hypothetical protein